MNNFSERLEKAIRDQDWERVNEIKKELQVEEQKPVETPSPPKPIDRFVTKTEQGKPGVVISTQPSSEMGDEHSASVSKPDPIKSRPDCVTPIYKDQ